mmetsp:Transcript_2520/g.7492  ORF Transcript_2520/g.7492 Transcript_2520/m.7492 type:complete len:247 (+) Transcript_2520:1174-1914(+)
MTFAASAVFRWSSDEDSSSRTPTWACLPALATRSSRWSIFNSGVPGKASSMSWKWSCVTRKTLVSRWLSTRFSTCNTRGIESASMPANGSSRTMALASRATAICTLSASSSFFRWPPDSPGMSSMPINLPPMSLSVGTSISFRSSSNCSRPAALSGSKLRNMSTRSCGLNLRNARASLEGSLSKDVHRILRHHHDVPVGQQLCQPRHQPRLARPSGPANDEHLVLVQRRPNQLVRLLVVAAHRRGR